MIASAASLGESTVDSPQLAAEDLLSLWVGNLPAQVASGIAEKVSAQEIERRTKRGTQVFLRAYANPGAPRAIRARHQANSDITKPSLLVSQAR